MFYPQSTAGISGCRWAKKLFSREMRRKVSQKGKVFFVFFVFTASAWLVPASIARGQGVAVGVVQVVVGDGNPDAEASNPVNTVPLPLINIDEEMSGYVRRAQEMIASKDYAGAIEILQALLDRTEQCFVSTDDPHRFVSLSVKAGEIIGKIPPEGIKLYQGLYDPRAERLFRSAADRFDESALRRIIDRYLYTSYGDNVLNLLGAVLFDRGEFSQAARCWQRVVAIDGRNGSDGASKNEALLLASIAVAHHFAGESSQASKAANLLAERYPKTVAAFGGRDENVVEFVRRMLAKSPPPAEVRHEEGWPSLAGAPDAVAVMSSVRPVLSPRWSTFASDPSGINIRSHVPVFSGRGQAVQAPTVSLQEGRVVLISQSGNTVTETVMPALIHPIVVDKTMIYRTTRGISAHDLLTGEKLWETLEFPLYRQAETQGGFRMTGQINVEDMGLWTVTAGGGRIYAPGGLMPWVPSHRFQVMGQSGMDNSALAAFSIIEQGRQLWQIGSGSGDSDLIRGGKFLTAPTYTSGRLYVLVDYTQSHHLVCLDAQNGRLIWETMVGQTPVQNINNRNITQDRTSPPAVADGLVFVVTNAGVAAAFHADTGKPLWAYQYQSQTPAGSNSGLSAPPNPIIVTAGRAICLPADCEQVLALRTDTGQLEWSVDRSGQRDLTAAGGTRLLLSGEDLRIIDATDGREIWKAEGVNGIHGRPAVTPDAVLASGRGEVVRVSLPEFRIARIPLVEPDAILGNLIGIDGKMVAANAAGVSMYSAFEDARTELTARIANASPEEVQDLLYKRAANAFNAEKPSEALTDLLKVRKIAEDRGDSVLQGQIAQMLYRTYVSLADHRSSNSVVALDFYNKALEYAYSDRSRGEMMVRLVKYYGDIGGGVKAAELAQEITTSYARTDLADVQIGKDADPFVRDNVDTQRFDGYELGHRLIKDLIARHGQECYGAFDAKASSALADAITYDEPEAMVRVADTWRYSKAAPIALLRAAEYYYQQSLQVEESARRDMLVLAGRILIRIRREYPDSGLSDSAALGLAMVYQQLNPRIMWLGLQRLEEAQGDTVVSFADVSGSVGEILKRFSSGLGSSPPMPSALPGSINPPMERIFAGSEDEPPLVLRGTDGSPLRCGDDLFLLRGQRICRFDPSAGSFKDGVKWETASLISTSHLYQQYAPWTFAAGLNSDSTVLAVVSRGGFVGVDVETGKVLWHRTIGEPMIAGIHSMAMGDDRCVVLTHDGNIHVLGMRSGKELWTRRMEGKQSRWWSPLQIAGGMLLLCDGQPDRQASVFDLTTKKLLGSIALGQKSTQAYLTDNGLIVSCDGRSIQLIEPLLGMDQPVWKVDSAANLAPAILGVTDTHVLVSPAADSGLVEMRSLADSGRIVRTFQTKPVAGKTAIPVKAMVVNNRLYVIADSTISSQRGALTAGRFFYCKEPTLHAFDLTTAEALWSADLSSDTKMASCIMPLQVGGNHISVIVKGPSHYQSPVAMVIETGGGKVVQKLTLPNRMSARTDERVRHMYLGSPVIAADRLVVETHTGLEIYGRK